MGALPKPRLQVALDTTDLVDALIDPAACRAFANEARASFVRALEKQRGAPAATAPTVEERALAEASSFALRVDVTEELDRLDAHLAEVLNVVRQGKDVGKRLDFLAQEMHREANTLGSKSASLELSRISLDMKILIEQMREQVQNIE